MVGKHIMDTLSSSDKHTIDIMGILALMGVFVEALPSIVLFLTGVWTLLRIYESDTIQKVVKRKRKEDTDGESTDTE